MQIIKISGKGKKKAGIISCLNMRTHGSVYIPQPKPELPQEDVPEPRETLPADELNADISLSAFFSPQTGQTMDATSTLDENTNSSNIC